MEQGGLMEHSEILANEQSQERLGCLGAEIRMLKGQAQQMAVAYAVEIGRRLTEAKAMVPYGEWGEWLKREVEYSQSTAQSLMKVYRECSDEQVSLFGPSKSQALGNLSYTKVLRILTIPEGPERDEFMETHDVAQMSTRELEAALKERDDARKAAEQARAEQAAADAARERMSADMALANERIAGLNAAVEEQSAREKEAREAAARLEKELADLRSRPVEVAVEPDTAAIEAARKEAEAAMQAKLDKAKAAQAKAEKARKAAEDAQAAARKELEQAKADAQAALEKAVAEGQAIREQAERERKKAAVTTDADMVLFSELYDQVQTLVKRMGGVRLKKRDKDPEKAERLQNALMALIPVVKEAAGQ